MFKFQEYEVELHTHSSLIQEIQQLKDTVRKNKQILANTNNASYLYADSPIICRLIYSPVQYRHRRLRFLPTER